MRAWPRFEVMGLVLLFGLVKGGEHLGPGSIAGESDKVTVLGPRASAPLWHRLSRGTSVGMTLVREWTDT